MNEILINVVSSGSFTLLGVLASSRASRQRADTRAGDVRYCKNTGAPDPT